jgi:biopolymer transport protein ExbB
MKFWGHLFGYPHGARTKAHALILVLVGALCTIPTSASAAWWQTDWSYRKQITIDTSPKGGNIAESAGRVPVLIRLHSGNFSFADAQENGTDIRFVAADDKTPLAYHIESYDTVLGMAAIWVDVPEFPAAATKDIWLYYANKKATPGADAAGTFDPDYTLVYHFDDAAGTPVHDKTANANNATTAAPAIDEGAIIGKGARFTGAGAINVPASTSLAIKAGDSFTFSAWVKYSAPQARAALYARRDGTGSLIVGVNQGAPFVEVNGSAVPVKLASPQALRAGQWSHVAATADGKTVTLYVNGHSVASGPGALPALNTPTGIGGDVQPGSDVVGFAGGMDEVRLSRIARSAAVMMADAEGQGPAAKLVVFGADEKQSGFGFGYFGIIIKSVTIDAWVVIGILGIMAAMSWFVMWSKSNYIGSVARANDRFLDYYRQRSGDPFAIEHDMEGRDRERRRLAQSSIYRVFHSGSQELLRRANGSHTVQLDAQGIEVVRALMDATLVRENQKLANNMVLLTISISGGPFLGLLGTVVGVMITFAAIAASGDVNINAIAPGISAALLATVAGLGVAIPALFGYNYLLTRSKNVTANMQVFVDEFVARISEIYRVAH